MSRPKRKRAWRALQAGRTPREVGGAWVLHLPSKGGPLESFGQMVEQENERIARSMAVPSHLLQGGSSYAAAKVQQRVTEGRFAADCARMFGGAK